jgi:hypothetical protein
MGPVTLKRLPDWHSRLIRAVEEVRRAPLVWGASDCGLDWAGRAVLAVTGQNPAAGLKPRYKTAQGALAFLRGQKVENLADLVARFLPEIHPSRAVIGDIAAIKTDDAFGFALGIVNGETILVRGEDGVRVLNLLDADRAFAVGERLTS